MLSLTDCDTVLNATKDNRERFGRIVQMHANQRKDLTTVYAGDIAAAVGLKNTTTGDSRGENRGRRNLRRPDRQSRRTRSIRMRRGRMYEKIKRKKAPEQSVFDERFRGSVRGR